MSGYSWVAVISIFSYLFLLVTLLTSQKSNRVIHTFIRLLAIMILWNGGSFGMRAQLWPSVNFWHHVSLLGMMLLPVGYFHFALDFLDENHHHGRKFWAACYLLLFVVNLFTGFFIPLPVVLVENGRAQFLYHYDWRIYLLFAIILVTVTQLLLIIWRHCRCNRIAFQQLLPILCGILILLLGHVLATLPIFAGLPLDMVSGVVNALFLFYALYKKKLFRMTILLSKANYGIMAIIAGIAIFSNFAQLITRFLMQELGMDYVVATVIITALLVVIIAALYFLIKAAFAAIFTRTEQQQNEMISRFVEEITHILSVGDILQMLSDTVQKAVEVNRLFLLIQGPEGHYRIEHTNNPLDEKNFYVRSDHPLITYFKKRKDCILFRDFSRNTIYRSMWEKEKALLINLQIECFAPLLCDDELIGFMMLSGKHGKSVCHPSNLRFLRSLCDICAVAVKNAYNYEKALKEAQKDDLTGLVNHKFFFEILNREFEKHKDTALSLCLIDIDDFKLFNQLYGTRVGDIALQRVASILASCISENGYAARIDNDEFALILPGYDLYSAKCLAENVAAQINEINTSLTVEQSRKLTVSIGICAAPYMASTSKELYRNADTTVYTVKRTGKNAVQMYSAEISHRNVSSLHKSGYDEHAGTIYALTAAIDAKDHYTFQHSQNVAYYASELAKAAGMAEDVVEIVREAGLLHDIGKIGIREDILNKPGKLTQDEYEAMKSHVENAVNIIRHLPSLDYVIPAVLSHHERYDGRGYPSRLVEENIPITGRILCIADAYDAITSDRNYKDATPPEEAVVILRSEAGKQFDPSLAEVFAELVESGKLELRASQLNKQEKASPVESAVVPV